MYYIYMTTNKINGKKYIGQHKGKKEDCYLGSGVLILKAIQKYGKENFTKTILAEAETQEEIDELEKEFIAKYDAVNNEEFYNIASGGHLTEIAEINKRWKKSLTEEEKQEFYKKNVERLQKTVKEWRKNNPDIVERNKQNLIQSAKKWREEHPEEVAQIMEKVNQKKEEWQKNNPEKHKEQIERWRKMGSEANSQKVICITTGEIYASQCEASRQTGVPQTNISKCLRGERKSAGKHPITKEKLVWRLYEEE